MEAMDYASVIFTSSLEVYASVIHSGHYKNVFIIGKVNRTHNDENN